MSYLVEKLSYDQLFRMSDPKRVRRSHTVHGPPLEIDSFQDAAYYIFNFKSNPSTTGLRHKGYIKFFRPRTGNANKPLHKLDCLVDCTCFSGDTQVLMSDGTYKPISEIRPGDSVYTHKGRVRRVLGNVERNLNATETVYCMDVTGFPGSFTVTGQHPFYALRGNDKCLCGCGRSLHEAKYRTNRRLWSLSTMLSKKYIRGHYRSGDTVKNLSDGTFTWVKVDDLRPQEWFLSPWMEAGNRNVPDSFARLVGYYVAEGCIPNKRGTAVRLTFNQNEWNTLVADVRSIGTELGYTVRCKKRQWKEQKWAEVTILNHEFRSFCLQNVGTGSNRKKLSEEVLTWAPTALQNLFTGAVLGDGWIDPSGRLKYLSMNFGLACQFSGILNRLRVRHTVSNHSKADNRTEMFQVLIPRGEPTITVLAWLAPYLRDKDKIKVALNDETHDTGYCRKEGQLRTMVKRERSNYTGTVWDLSVDEDESFIVHGVAVHNCPDYKYRWAWANKQRGSSQVGVASLNQAWNRAPRITNPGSVPGLCKHILAAREFIYGLISNFEPGEPDTADKLNKLTRYAQKRWVNFPGEMAKARERDARIAAARAARNAGRPLPAKPAEPEPEEAPAKDVNLTGKATKLKDLKPPPLPPAAAPGAAPTQVPLAVPPGQRGLGFPAPAKPATPPAAPKPSTGAPKKAGPFSQFAKRFMRRENLETGVVVKAGQTVNRTTMNELNEARKLISELEQDALETPEAPVGGEFDSALPPSEPPVSDSAIGADTEGETALGLLRGIKTDLDRLADELAPLPEPGDEAGEPSVEEIEGEGPMPDEDIIPEPPAGGEEEPEEEGEPEDEDEIPDRRPEPVA